MVKTYPFEARIALLGLLARQVAQPVIFGFGITVRAVIEGCMTSTGISLVHVFLLLLDVVVVFLFMFGSVSSARRKGIHQQVQRQKRKAAMWGSEVGAQAPVSLSFFFFLLEIRGLVHLIWRG